MLLVEDEVLVAALAVDALEELGYQSVEATTAKGAREIASSGAALAFAVIDVGLPDGRGDALALELRGMRPDLPIIIATGYDGAHLDERLRGDTRIRRCWASPTTSRSSRLRSNQSFKCSSALIESAAVPGNDSRCGRLVPGWCARRTRYRNIGHEPSGKALSSLDKLWRVEFIAAIKVLSRARLESSSHA